MIDVLSSLLGQCLRNAQRRLDLLQQRNTVCSYGFRHAHQLCVPSDNEQKKKEERKKWNIAFADWQRTWIIQLDPNSNIEERGNLIVVKTTYPTDDSRMLALQHNARPNSNFQAW
jgi:hypothetical protein